MANYRLTVTSCCLLGLALVAACDKKSDAPADTTPARSATPAATSAAVAASTAPATEMAPAASASASASAGAVGDVHLHLDKVKVTGGKIDGVDRKFKSRSAALSKKCLAPAVKKEPAIDGELKLVIDLDGDGKVTKQVSTVTGKVPDDLVACVKKYIEKELEFDTDSTKPKAEVVYKFGPHADEAEKK